MIWTEKSIRGRKCHTCRGMVPPNDIVICYKGSGWYPRNICRECLAKILIKADAEAIE